jgi:hypothetical protein
MGGCLNCIISSDAFILCWGLLVGAELWIGLRGKDTPLGVRNKRITTDSDGTRQRRQLAAPDLQTCWELDVRTRVNHLDMEGRAGRSISLVAD